MVLVKLWRVLGCRADSPAENFVRSAEVGRLLLVHIDPLRPDDDPIGIETARAIYPATEVAEDRMAIEF